MPSIQLRHDTSTNWTTYNPVLLEGEVGIETDTNKMKIGDGTTAYNSLEYFGGDIDLSDYYDKTETDGLLNDKQDKLTPNAPLSISTYSKSSLVGLSYTQDGTGVYSTKIVAGECPYTTSIVPGTRLWGMACYFTGGGIRGANISTVLSDMGYIDIPYTFGDIVTSTAGNIPNIWFGISDDNGAFTPVVTSRAFGSDITANGILINTTENLYLQTSSVSDVGYPYFLNFRTGASDLGANTSTDTVSMFQVQHNEANDVITYRGSTHTYRLTVTDASARAVISKINTARLVIMNNVGSSASTPISVSTIGRYVYNGLLDGTLNVSDLGENQFVVGQVIASNYIDLNIGTGLSVDSNGNLVNTNPTPVDLTNYYNKGEVNTLLDGKQDILTPNDPLTISTYTKSNLVGFSYADGSHIYSTSEQQEEYYAVYDGDYNRIAYSTRDGWVSTSTFSTTVENFKSYIDVPIKADKMITIPQNMNAIIGYYNENGIFMPVAGPLNSFRYGDGSGCWLEYDGPSYRYYLKDNVTEISSTSVSLSYVPYTKIYLTQTSSGIRLHWNRNYSDNTTAGHYVDINGELPIASKIAIARITRANGSAGYNVSTAIDVSNLGVYAYVGNFADFDPTGLTNEFDISGVQSYNYLDLHIGNGLAVQNGNLVNTNPTAPTVMTGATSSTAGTSGLVPAPQAGDNEKFLSGDGTYKTAGSSVTVDQTYDGTSSNAQSGTAVAEAISDCVQNDDLSEVQVVVESSDISLLPSFYKVFSDGTCIQGGNCTSGTAVTFLKEFANMNYINTCSMSTSSTTGFTPSATGSYIVVGKVNLTTANS